MSNVVATPKPSKIRRNIGLGLVLVLVFSVFMVFSTATVMGRVADTKETDIPLFEAAWELRYLDEVKTQSAARYIGASESERDVWSSRYRSAATELGDVLLFALSEATPEESEFLHDVSGANYSMALLEDHLFALTSDGSTDRALAVLEGDYQTYKGDYSNGLDGFFEAQEERLSASVDTVSRAAALSRYIVMGLVVAMGFVLFRIYRSVEELAERNAEVQVATDAKTQALVEALDNSEATTKVQARQLQMAGSH